MYKSGGNFPKFPPFLNSVSTHLKHVDRYTEPVWQDIKAGHVWIISEGNYQYQYPSRLVLFFPLFSCHLSSAYSPIGRITSFSR